MTELSFLIDLLLNHKLPPKTKDAVAGRIKEVEALLSTPFPKQHQILSQSHPPEIFGNGTHNHIIGGAKQAASTTALLAKYPDLVEQMEKSATKGYGVMTPESIRKELAAPQPELPPVEIVAQTPLAASAIASRQAAIAQQISGLPEKGRKSPRKF